MLPMGAFILFLSYIFEEIITSRLFWEKRNFLRQNLEARKYFIER
jgi:hypothetical protein